MMHVKFQNMKFQKFKIPKNLKNLKFQKNFKNFEFQKNSKKYLEIPKTIMKFQK
jgi:hypothetical protein